MNNTRFHSLLLASTLGLLAAGCGDSTTEVPDGGFGDLTGVVPDMSRIINKDAACASVSAAANLTKKPVDIIFVIDNSQSMTSEIVSVQNNINQNFADIIGKSGLDYRVIMLSHHGSATADQSICVSQPLSGNATCMPPPNRPTNTARFFHYSIEIGSHDSFSQILNTYNQADQFGLAPNGWAAWLRPDAYKVFIEITDDDATNLTATNFETQLFNKNPKMFGSATMRNYVFHTIAGLKENNPVTKPWDPADPIQTALCTSGGGAVANGIEYQRLSKTTGGVRFPICEYANFNAVFQYVAMGVVAGSKVNCDFAVPPAPMGQMIDFPSVVVAYTATGGGTTLFKQVADVSQCAANSFYIENKMKIVLCPAACTTVQADTQAQVNVLFDCETPIG